MPTDDVNLGESDIRLIVNGKDITEGNYVDIVVDETGKFLYTEMPFVAVMEELGAEFEWTSDTTANMMFDGKTYILDIANFTLLLDGVNNLYPAPGTNWHARTIGREMLINDSVLYWFIPNVKTGWSITEKYLSITTE